MQMGIEWNEDLPYSDPRNGEIAMEYAKDRYQFVLKQKIISQPGKKWHHNGGPTALIVRLIAKGTGKNIDQYAAEKLFNPLGITNFEWAAGGDGEPSAASRLRLNIRDLAKTGQLVSNGGRYNGQ
jgi:CubicO group peptidase (beta-lactamase class C family)